METTKKAKRFTEKFLNLCKDRGIKRVAIETYDGKLKTCRRWPFEYVGSIFTNKIDDEDGWPVIWGIVKDLKISIGCGNDAQHNINSFGSKNLINGVYKLKNNEWIKEK